MGLQRPFWNEILSTTIDYALYVLGSSTVGRFGTLDTLLECVLFYLDHGDASAVKGSDDLRPIPAHEFAATLRLGEGAFTHILVERVVGHVQLAAGGLPADVSRDDVPYVTLRAAYPPNDFEF